jgi:hypothetical protein
VANDFFEFLNLYLVMLDIPALVILWRYLYANVGRWGAAGTQLGIGLFIYVLGHTIIRGWTWVWRFSRNHNVEVDWIGLILPFGLVITTVGLICVMRSVTGTISDRLWIGLAISFAIFAGLITWLT